MGDDSLIHNPNGGMPRLLEIMRRLRNPDTGCPWDIEQDFASIAPYTIEEAYEGKIFTFNYSSNTNWQIISFN